MQTAYHTQETMDSILYDQLKKKKITIFNRSGFFDPVSEVSNKVKKEVSIWHTDDLREAK